MKLAVFRAALTRDEDVVHARQWTRAVAAGLGFSAQDQTRIATAASEIARNAVAYAKRGRIEFEIDATGRRPGLVIRILDAGPGIEGLDAVLAGRFRSKTGLGLGITGARRLMDAFEIASTPSGTTVTMAKFLPNGDVGLTEADLRHRGQRAAAYLERLRATDPVAEVQQQNRELLASLQRLREREEELVKVNRDLQAATEALAAAVSEKDVLIREVHHRVKNNLQIIGSLISLQVSRSGSPEAKRELNSLAGRIRSLSLIHDKLYQGANLARLGLRDYVRDLCRHLAAFLEEPGRQIRLTCELCELELPLDTAINLGLIVNELVTNAYKHAFPGDGPGRIRVTAAVKDRALEISVTDSGTGIAAEPQRSGPDRSLGMTLVRNMAARMDGTVRVDTGHGTTVVVTVPLPPGSATDPARPDEAPPGELR